MAKMLWPWVVFEHLQSPNGHYYSLHSFLSAAWGSLGCSRQSNSFQKCLFGLESGLCVGHLRAFTSGKLCLHGTHFAHRKKGGRNIVLSQHKGILSNLRLLTNLWLYTVVHISHCFYIEDVIEDYCVCKSVIWLAFSIKLCMCVCPCRIHLRVIRHVALPV